MKLKQIRVSGYKNLIDCKVDLGDFNVIVGPNNSGKSNFLEVFQIFSLLCFGSEPVREIVLNGYPTRSVGRSICKLLHYENHPLSIGFTIEKSIGGAKWIINYDLLLQMDFEGKGKGGFLSETLTAKKPSSTGIPVTYIKRDKRTLKIYNKKKERNIALDMSALMFINTLYPNLKGLPSEFKGFLKSINEIAFTLTLALSPESLRKSLDEKVDFNLFRTTSFDLDLIIGKIYENKKKYQEFSEIVSDVLEIEKMTVGHLITKLPDERTKTKSVKGKKHKRKETEKKAICMLKRTGTDYNHIQEYSDGTFNVLAILATMFSDKQSSYFICIEELENCLHPAALERMLRFLQDNSSRCPVLLTTHSPYLLNGVNPSDINVAIINEYGATSFKKVKSRRQLSNFLNKSLMSFGDLLVSNYEGFIEE